MNNFKIFNLNNGFKYLTIKNNNIEHCILLILLGTGSVFETEELSGISHYLEHMPFKGTKNYKPYLVTSTEHPEIVTTAKLNA